MPSCMGTKTPPDTQIYNNKLALSHKFTSPLQLNFINRIISQLFESLMQRQTKKSAFQAKYVIRIWDVANRRVSRCRGAWAESPPSCTWVSCIRPSPSVWPRCTGTWSALGWPSPCRASAFYTWIQDTVGAKRWRRKLPKPKPKIFIEMFLQ